MATKPAIAIDPVVMVAKGRPKCCPDCGEAGTLQPVGTPIVKNGVLKAFAIEWFLCISCDETYPVAELEDAPLGDTAPAPIGG